MNTIQYDYDMCVAYDANGTTTDGQALRDKKLYITSPIHECPDCVEKTQC